MVDEPYIPTVTCEICGKDFDKVANFANHQSRHQQGFDCPVCHTPHQSAEDVLIHLNWHHPDLVQPGGERPTQDAEAEFEPRWNITNTSSRLSHHFQKVTTSKTAQLENSRHFQPTQRNIDRLFETLVEDSIQDADPADKIGITLESPTLDFPLVIPYITASNFKSDKIYEILERTLNSNQSFSLDSRLKINIDRVQIPEGRGKSLKRRSAGPARYADLEACFKSKKSVVRIRADDDNLCLPTAILVGIERYKAYNTQEPNNFESYRKLQTLFRGRRGVVRLKKLARQLLDRVGIGAETGCGVGELGKIQKVLPDYQLNVFQAGSSSERLFRGANEGRPIYLLLDERRKHYHVLVKPSNFYGYKAYCHKCNVFSHDDSRFAHVCEEKCHGCFRPAHVQTERVEKTVKCKDCRRLFISSKCFENHKTLLGREPATTCAQYQMCEKCNRPCTIKNHKCGLYCKFCFEHYPKGEKHDCFIQVKKLKGNPKHKFVFFDIESMMVPVTEEAKLNSEHQPILLIAQRVCQPCANAGEKAPAECDVCGVHTFRGTECVTDFLKWLFGDPKAQDTTVLGHNFRSYDGQFIVTGLRAEGRECEFVTKGMKILQIDVTRTGVRFVDSLSFLLAPLHALPKMFGFGASKKGFFPHALNTPDNQDYEGLFPDREYYAPQNMKGGFSERTGEVTGELAEFEDFYKRMKGKVFNLQKELYEYCLQDVHILKRACLQFRKDLITVTGIDPLISHITLSQLAMDFFRGGLMKEKTIAQISANTHHSNERQSAVGLQWLLYVEQQLGRELVKKSSLGEHKVGPYRVDGYDPVTHTVYEFLGDFWHGNPKIYSPGTVNKKLSCTMGDLYEKTQQRLLAIETAEKCKMVTIWESDFHANPAMRAFAATCEVVAPLQPREALYGGRTNATTLKYTVKDGEKIRYYDFCSLYPSVLKYCRFPVGHPEIIIKDFKEVSSYYGLIKCTVLPPQRLYHPVLPQRFSNGKLTFTLCRTCADETNQGLCEHTEAERALKGTWPSPELEKAIEKGYIVQKIHEVWHFKVSSQLDRTTREGGLFASYVDTFFKLKLKYSGWPSWVTDEDKEDEYIDQILQREGIQLRKGEIEKNPGLRTLAKLLLNSFWGKFAQRSNLSKKKLVKSRAEMLELITDETLIVECMVELGDEELMVSYKSRDPFSDPSAASNVVIAAFVTCQARLKLYDLLDKLGERILYFDTDSAFWVDTGRAEDYTPPTGSFLGDLTDELNPDNYIVQFVSGGAKNYSYKLKDFDGEYRTKTVIKGISMNSSNQKIACFDKVLEKVEAYVNDFDTSTSVFYDTNIHFYRSPEFRIFMVNLQKRYKICYDKRVICADFSTIPYGYRALPPAERVLRGCRMDTG